MLAPGRSGEGIGIIFHRFYYFAAGKLIETDSKNRRAFLRHYKHLGNNAAAGDMRAQKLIS